MLVQYSSSTILVLVVLLADMADVLIRQERYLYINALECGLFSNSSPSTPCLIILLCCTFAALDLGLHVVRMYFHDAPFGGGIVWAAPNTADHLSHGSIVHKQVISGAV